MIASKLNRQIISLLKRPLTQYWIAPFKVPQGRTLVITAWCNAKKSEKYSYKINRKSIYHGS